MLARYCGPGLLGLGITALIAGFMSGMAGNVSAFTTVWTYDIYGSLVDKSATDEFKVKMGRWVTVIGVIISIGTAYIAAGAPSIMEYVALSSHAQDQAQNMFRALWCCLICVVVTVVVSYLTKPKPDSELKDVVYGLTPIPKVEHVSIFQSPIFWAVVVAVIFIVLKIIFW